MSVAEGSEVGAIVGPYRVLRPIASGGMGRVYLARHVELGRLAALKFLSRTLVGSARARAQFTFEARATASLSHPNVITVYDVGEHGGRPYVALEYVHGRTLHQLLRADPPTIGRAAQLAEGIARAIAAAHDVGLLHRDLKPSNVVVGHDDRVRVLDFGIARLVEEDGPVAPDDLTRFDLRPSAISRSPDASIAGTPAYMAPEQWEGRDARGTDSWAIGLVLYEMLARKQPLAGLDPVALMARLDGEQPFPPLPSRVPPELSALVLRCLSRDPGARPSAAEIATELARLAPTLATREPYRGLAAYERRDADVFRGREREIDELVARVEREPLTRVVGPAGVGKTSLVRAGLVPRLEATQRWHVLVVEPGPSPFASIARAIADASEGRDDRDLEARLRASPGALGLALGRLATALRKRVLLVIDPLDDPSSERDETRLLGAALARAVGDPAEPVRIVVVARDETITGDPSTATTRVRPLAGAALHEAITRSLDRAEAEDATIVDVLVEETSAAASSASLPIVSLVLQRLWERREGTSLTRADYDAIGGAVGALAAHAEAWVARLSDADLGLARAVLRRTADAGTIARERLVAGLGDAASALVERLVDERILARDGETITLAHPGLVRAWPRLAEWIATQPDVHRTVLAAAERWARSGRARALLLTRAELDELAAAGGAPPAWPEDARALVRASEDALRARRVITIAIGVSIAIVILAVALTR
ncbi:serine/threonine-protein kinase [Sandaracinus amylolyticus]|uniref:Serine/threonine protein kinase n=1 Tax=Sandaracinus amylolyticus TaxID=927083 RepID=A0A0F6YGA7_9BACT|nr:serine/threonine-protein kinase [Sandaracinus amylolyticus]AKF03716.1 Serine/threonine protein kinase [Sandaracinus amylolyticus]